MCKGLRVPTFKAQSFTVFVGAEAGCHVREIRPRGVFAVENVCFVFGGGGGVVVVFVSYCGKFFSKKT